ncbi:MAG: hypothetical protein HYY35_04225 [Deltaproteobacteria bacterium]|nr:hypothetical protein [Deltaproteobacteria bacterium]
MLLLPTLARAQGILEFLRGHTHGYVENFTILRSDTFKDDYHVASSRYRTSLQFSGPMMAEGARPLGLLDRLEYFMELRPEYESIYDLSGRFGSPGRATSGRGKPLGASNAGFVSAFGFDPHDFEEIYQKSNLLLPSPRSPDVDFVDPRTQREAWYDLDASGTDLRLGRLQATNWDLYYPIREFYIDAYFDAAGGKNWLRIGKQQHVWGKADFFRLQDVVNPVNFAEHFFIDPFDDTRIPLWSALFEHRFGDVGPFKQLAGSVVWVFDRYTPLGFGNGAQPWAIGFGRELGTFAFGNDLFGDAIFPGEGVNASFFNNASPRWNLKNTGVGTKWVWLFGNVRVQLTDWFAYQDVPAFAWNKLHILDIPGCNEVLPAPGAVGGRTVITNPAATGVPLPVRINVRPNAINMNAAGVVAGEPDEIKQARYINICGLTGELEARYRKQNTLGVSFDWFEPNTGVVIRSENSWTVNALVTDSTQRNWLNDTNIVRWVMGVDRPTMIRALNPLRSFFLSAQAFGTHLTDVKAGRFGNVNGSNDNFIFTSFAQTQYLRDQLVVLVFGAYGVTGKDATLGGNFEYLYDNHLSLQLGVTGFLGVRREHDIGPFANFTTDGRPFTETGFGIGHMQAGGSERNQMDEFWGRMRYRF